MPSFCTIRSLSLLYAALLPCAIAQTPDQIVHWSAVLKPSTVRPGGQTVATLTGKIESGWHVYAVSQAPGGPIKTSVRVPEGQSFHATGVVKGTKPEVSFDKNFNMNTEFYQHAVSLDLPLTADEKAAAGQQKVKIDVRFQTCSDRLCLPPATIHMQADATVRK